MLKTFKSIYDAKTAVRKRNINKKKEKTKAKTFRLIFGNANLKMWIAAKNVNKTKVEAQSMRHRPSN